MTEQHRWNTSTRKARLPHDWSKIRLRVLRRDSYECQHRSGTGPRCLMPGNDVDHVEPGDDHRDANLRTLCTWHHRRKSSAEGAAARAPQRTKTREPDAHPGAYAE